MGPDSDYIEPIRRIVAPIIGRITSVLEDGIDGNVTTTQAQGPDQYVATVEANEEPFEEQLADYGFQRNPLAWLKKNRSGEVEEGSWRLVSGDKQVHLVLYDGSMQPDANTGHLLLYAHKEYRWDRYPIKHLRGNEIEYIPAKYVVWDMLDQSGSKYTVESKRL